MIKKLLKTVVYVSVAMFLLPIVSFFTHYQEKNTLSSLKPDSTLLGSNIVLADQPHDGGGGSDCDAGGDAGGDCD